MTAARSRYSRAAISLHWLIAALLIGNFACGLLMGNLWQPRATPEQRQLGLMLLQMHKSFGLTVLVLSLLRLALRLTQGVPPLPAHMTGMERLLARTTHAGLYAVMILLPLSGWLMLSASPLAGVTRYFGLFDWPRLPVEASLALSGSASEAHGLIGYMGAALFLLHVAGALKQHFLDRDEVLARIVPLRRRA